MRVAQLAPALLLGVGVLADCQSYAPEENQPEPVSKTSQGLDAICTVEVIKDGESLGVKDVEGDYLPNVVNCESGDLDMEALKVQAVTARTYVYYKLGKGGTQITSGTSVQVYDCARKIYLAQKHYDAVNATAGQILQYKGNPIWPCFVAGVSPTNPPCTPGSGADNCCTSNEGKSGDTIEQSPCGYVDPTNYKNRGCVCQNGADCYAKQGKTYTEILKAYFGEDIQFVTITGNCSSTQDSGQPNQDASNPTEDASNPGKDASNPSNDSSTIKDSQTQDKSNATDSNAKPNDGSAASAGSAGSAGSGAQFSPSSGDDGGCSLSPTAPRGAGHLLLVLAALLGLARNRRAILRGSGR